jgi:hypothetical protein
MALPHTRQKWERDPPFSPRRDATKRPSYRDLGFAARENPTMGFTARRSPPLESWANRTGLQGFPSIIPLYGA